MDNPRLLRSVPTFRGVFTLPLTKVRASSPKNLLWGDLLPNITVRCSSSRKGLQPLVRVMQKEIVPSREGTEGWNKGLETCMKVGIAGIKRHHIHLKGAETWFQHPPILLRVGL